MKGAVKKCAKQQTATIKSYTNDDEKEEKKLFKKSCRVRSVCARTRSPARWPISLFHLHLLRSDRYSISIWSRFETGLHVYWSLCVWRKTNKKLFFRAPVWQRSRKMTINVQLNNVLNLRFEQQKRTNRKSAIKMQWKYLAKHVSKKDCAFLHQTEPHKQSRAFVFV